jgi:hypothetical protein
MAEMLLINPATRGKRKTKRRTTARRRNPIKAGSPTMAVRRNPLYGPKRKRRSMATMKRRVMRGRRRNPIGGGMAGGYMGAIREAVMGGAGAVVMDLAYGQINNFLPASLKRTPGSVGAGDAVKAVITVALGHMLNKATRGFSRKAAQASLTVQATEIMRSFVPASMSLGYATPAYVAQGTPRTGPIRRGVNGLRAYTGGGGSPMLSAYTPAGGMTPMLNGARMREGVTSYR